MSQDAKGSGNIRRRILAPLGFTLGFILISTLLSFNLFARKVLDNNLGTAIESLESELLSHVDEDTETMIALLDGIETESGLQSAWRRQDRDELFGIAKTKLEDMQARFHITHFYFHELDGNCFLRVHDPQRFGDFIERHTMEEASRLGETHYGLELGPLGTFTLRVVRPWMIDGKLAGYIELGEEIDHIVPGLKRMISAELMFLIEKQYVDRSNWEAGLKSLGKEGSWDLLNGYIVSRHTPELPMKELRVELSRLKGHSTERQFKIETERGQFLCRFMPLIDSYDRRVGKIVVAKNVSADLINLRRRSAWTFFIVSTLGLAVYMIAYIYLGKVDRDLKNQTRSLDELVADSQVSLAKVHDMESEWRALVSGIPDHIITTTLDGQITFVNKRLPGSLRDEAIGCDIIEFLNPVEAEAMRDGIDVVVKTQKQVVVETEIRMKSSHTTWALIRLGPVWKDNEISAMLAIITDITSRKVMEDEIRSIANSLSESEEMFRTIGETAQDGIIIIDDAGKISYWNDSAQRIFGYSAHEVLGHALDDLLYPVDPQENAFQTLPGVGELSAGPIDGTTLELPGKHKDGNRVPCELSLSSMKLQNRWHAVGILRDITERKNAERENEQMKHDLLQADKLKAIGQLAAGIAHEINTPAQFVNDNIHFLKTSFIELGDVLDQVKRLTLENAEKPAAAELAQAISEALDQADTDFLTEEIPPAVAQSLDGVDRIKTIVQAMKEFSHPGGNSMRPGNINKAIETTIAIAKSEWKTVADLDLDLDPTLPNIPCFIGDINQVILNIVVNAGHAIEEAISETKEEKGTISISTRLLDDNIEIRIKDTGTGISDENLDRVFEPFFTTKELGKGTGQGLNIAHTLIVKKHSGELSIETEMGRGTTFIIRLPKTRKTKRPGDVESVQAPDELLSKQPT